MKSVYIKMSISALIFTWTFIQACKPIKLDDPALTLKDSSASFGNDLINPGEDLAHYQLKNEERINTSYDEFPVFILEKEICYFSGGSWGVLCAVNTVGQELKMNTKIPGVILPERWDGAGPVMISRNADTLYYTVYHDIGKRSTVFQLPRMELLISCKLNGHWTKPKAFTYNNISEFSVGQVALSRDGMLLYFVSDMPGGMGGFDIWYSTRRANGTWGIPLNAGPGINTPGDEVFPVVSPDGTLYYSTNGLTGLGGFDIFKTSGKASTWTKPQHLGTPLNSVADDFSLIWTSLNGGVFSSNRNGGKGGTDIYTFQVLESN